MNMQIIPLVVGPALTNCYILVYEKNCESIVIDPGFNENDENIVLGKIDELKITVKYIINTHGHADHISGNLRVKKETGASIVVHSYDVNMLTDPRKNLSRMIGSSVVSPPPDIVLQDGDEIKLGDLKIKVLHTPGHSPGSISLYLMEEDAIFTGDTLFAGSIGRTDIPGGSYRKLISSIKEK
ncbi:MAG: MBL fold metallo-hydrolase, partial [Candidatus Bathyarchaeia archaeon]